MDVFSATLCGAQALAYSLSVVKSLTECHVALRYGRGFLCDEQANVGQLQEIITQLEHRTSLDPYLRSLLQSINTTVHDLLLLVSRRKRLQLVILLVIRRTEVNESFALLERKKNTLNLYLNAQNSIAIASLKTGILPHSTQNLEMAHPRQIPFEKSAQGSDPGASHKETLPDPIRANSSAMLARKPQSSSSTTRSFVTIGNRASDKGHQTIFAPTSQNIDVLHEENETDGKAIQYIGKVEIVPSLLQKEDLGGMTKREKNVGGMKRYLFSTKNNKAMRGATQSIFAPQYQTSDIKHERNISEDHADQTIGKDPNVQPPATVSSKVIPSPSPRGKKPLFLPSKKQ